MNPKTDWYPTKDMNIALPEGFQNQDIEVLIIIDNRNTYINSFDSE